MTDPRMFEVAPATNPASGEMSATRRRTFRQRVQLSRGIHPATGQPVLHADPPVSCGDCAHCRQITGLSGRRYWKCDRHRLGTSASEASDIRKSWPACQLYIPIEETPCN